MSTPVPVVIVGAGPTGITAATLLAQYGIQCLLLDRYAHPYPQPRAVHLDDEIYRLLARLGIANDFGTISRPALGLRLLDQDLRVLAQFQRDPSTSIHGFPQANMFDQPQLEALLRANLARYPDAVLRANVEVTQVAQRDAGGVRVTFIDRGSAEVHVVDAAYLLGCDGANSIVRTAIGARMADLNFEQRWLVVDVAITADLHQWDGVHQVCDPVRAATFMRVGPTRYRWEFRLLPGEAAEDFRGLPSLRGLIEPWLDGIPDAGLEVVRLAEYTFRAQLADRWRDRDIFLLGDAAHLTPPFIGQGMGAGLRDAMNLVWKLAGVLNGDLPEGVLDTYEQERKPHTRFMITLALSMGWAMTAGGRLGNLIRRAVLTRLSFIPGIRIRLVSSRTPNLRCSALVVRSRRPRQLGGSLCPNSLLANGERLDALLRNGFALITVKPLTATQQARLRERGATLLTVEPDAELGRWLRQGRADAAIVRPDRTVMQAGRRIGTLCDAVPQFTQMTTARA